LEFKAQLYQDLGNTKKHTPGKKDLGGLRFDLCITMRVQPGEKIPTLLVYYYLGVTLYKAEL